MCCACRILTKTTQSFTESRPGKAGSESAYCVGIRVISFFKSTDDGLRECFVIARRNQSTGQTIGDSVRYATGCKCHRFQTVCGGFKCDHAETFVIMRELLNRENQNIGGEICFSQFKIIHF